MPKGKLTNSYFTITSVKIIIKKGFGGDTCREDNRFLEANANIPIAVLVAVFIFIMLSLVAWKCIPQKKHKQFNDYSRDKSLLRPLSTRINKLYIWSN